MKINYKKMRDNSNNNTMESFYEESAQYAPRPNLKRPLTLDLDTKIAKRPKFNQSLAAVPVLNTPDLKKMLIASPELEKMCLQSSSMHTPTPGPGTFYTSSKTFQVTSEQEQYAKGFEDALNNLHKGENGQSPQQQHQQPSQQQQKQQPPQQPPTISSAITTGLMSGGSVTYTNLDENYSVAIKDEPQPSTSPPISPIDMESQEQIKLERKRQRNRVAASKCRKRKLERISRLEDKVRNLKSDNTDLGSVIKQLKEYVFNLKQQVIDHMQHGCNINVVNMSYFKDHNGDGISEIK